MIVNLKRTFISGGELMSNNGIQYIPALLKDQNTQLENFIRQSKTAIENIINLCNDIQQQIINLHADIDNSLKQIEIDMESNHNLLSKWVNGANTKLMQEKVSTSRISILDKIKKIEENLNQYLGELKNTADALNNSSIQLAVNYKNLENQLNSSIPVQQSQAAASNNNLNNLIQMLKQAQDVLNAAKQGLDQRKVINEINSSIDKILH